MIKNSLINFKFLGREESDIINGKPANPLYDYEFEPSLTDQSFNYSISDKVEDFIAAGQIVQAASLAKNKIDFPVQHEILGLYSED